MKARSEPLQGVRGGYCRCQLIPVSHGPGEKCVGVYLARDSFSVEPTPRSTVARLQIQLLVNVHQVMFDPVQHAQPGLFSTLFKGVPFQPLQHSCHGSRGLAGVVTGGESCRSPLDLFQGSDVGLFYRIPDCCGVF